MNATVKASLATHAKTPSLLTTISPSKAQLNRGDMTGASHKLNDMSNPNGYRSTQLQASNWLTASGLPEAQYGEDTIMSIALFFLACYRT
jgi:hypothetical protein